MQHAEYFKDFLRDEVNLNQARIDKLEDRVESVYTALVEDPTIGSLIQDKIPQGSWPHKLIIKPQTDHEFDADFLLEIEHQDGWDPVRYREEVYSALHRHPRYSKQGHGRKCRCVWLRYAPENGVGCHLDIVPFVTLPDGRRVIVNGDLNCWEPGFGSTDPDGFTRWVRRRDELTDRNFRKVVRLMKYLKRERGSFNGVKSVILTTLLGEQVTELSATDAGRYTNIPTALLNIVTDLDAYLQRQDDTPPHLPNPSGDGTNFDHRWTSPTFRNFRDRINSIAEQMEAAYHETDPGKSAAAWQKLFGDRFQPPDSQKTGAASNPFAATAAIPGLASSRSGRSG
jgi:hypothetical protein